MGMHYLYSPRVLWSKWARACRAAYAPAAPAAPAVAPPVETSSSCSEFVAEVVRVLNVTPHPNADRLDLVHFELASSGPSSYEVVTQRGLWSPGDLAGYFSVDCVLPLDAPEFEFLAKGTTRSYHRLRAARLRGVFSQGLIVPVASYLRTFGASLADAFRVTYYRTPEDGEPTGPISSAARAPRELPIYGVESLKKSPSLFAPGETVVVTEKIHGCSALAGWVPKRFAGVRVGWRFVVGSHRTMKAISGSIDPETADSWLAAAVEHDLEQRTRAAPGYVFYGEIFGYSRSGKRLQDLTYGRTPEQGPGFVVFDVLDVRTKHYLSPSERDALCRKLGIEQVPLLLVTEWSPELRELAEGQSTLDPKQIREGIVVESLDGGPRRRKAKFVGQGYLLRKDA